MTVPAFDTLLSTFRARPAVRKYAEHNFLIWRRIRAGLAFVNAYPREFDPRADYWSLPERRLLVPYFTKTYYGRHAPPDALRALAFQIFRHFDTERSRGRFGAPIAADTQNERWSEIRSELRASAESLADVIEFAALREVWGARALGGSSLKESLISFIDETSEGISRFEKALGKRITWFPYLGLNSFADLADSQRFFYGFYSLFGSTNAYQNAGSQSFAPLLQNTALPTLIGYANRWAAGEQPSETKFLALGRDGDSPRDCSHYNTVTELYGFLNLPSGPIYNNAAAELYAEYRNEGDSGDLPQILRVGERTRAFLMGQPRLVGELSAEAWKLAASADDPDALVMEGIEGQKVAAKRPGDVALLIDAALRREQAEHFEKYLTSIGEFETASAFLHILLDAVLYEQNTAAGAEHSASGELAAPAERRAPTLPPAPPAGRRLVLAPGLRSVADEALSLLQAGFHVLLAGAPGTGKTTLAQIVGHAWNHELANVPVEIPLELSPKTVVAHSAWATFHTVGGLLPDKNGEFSVRPGVFVQATNERSIWSLRGECFVLDEMNRADLDRCIGDLYPILSRSVASVVPAGLPGVDRICDHERFRLLATVNDATLDDIVFPISEGLARRFLRIELRGATKKDALQYLKTEAADAERLAAATSALETTYDAARLGGKLMSTELGEHLPFGVGYLAPLRAWVNGELRIPLDADLPFQARHVLSLALRGRARVRGFDDVVKSLED